MMKFPYHDDINIDLISNKMLMFWCYSKIICHKNKRI